jgi:hypothetical protein
MTDLTRVLAFKTVSEAANAAGYWKELGYHVTVVGPTDAIKIDNGDGATIWESGTEADWYMVIASKAKMEVIAAKV